MNPIVNAFNIGFGNCVFMSRDPEKLAGKLMDKMVHNDIPFMPEIPVDIKVTPVDDLHDKLSLSLKDGSSVEGVLSWRKSIIDAHYVLNGLKI